MKMSSKRARRHQILVIAGVAKRNAKQRLYQDTTSLHLSKLRRRNIEAVKIRWFRQHYPLNGSYKDEKTKGIHEIVTLLKMFGRLKGVKKIK